MKIVLTKQKRIEGTSSLQKLVRKQTPKLISINVFGNSPRRLLVNMSSGSGMCPDDIFINKTWVHGFDSHKGGNKNVCVQFPRGKDMKHTKIK